MTFPPLPTPEAPASPDVAAPASSVPLRWPGSAWVTVAPHRLWKGPVRKKIAPQQPGAGRWSERFGHHLVCVRYRDDLDRQRRVVTVELVVDERPLKPSRAPTPVTAAPPPAPPSASRPSPVALRPPTFTTSTPAPAATAPDAPPPAPAGAAPSSRWVGLRFGVGQPELVRKAQSASAIWNPRTRLWILPRQAAQALDLAPWIVEDAPAWPTASTPADDLPQTR